MKWGYALVWPGEELKQRDEDPLIAKIKFLADFDLHSTGIHHKQFEDKDDDYVKRVHDLLEEHDIALSFHPINTVEGRFFDSDRQAVLDDVKRSLDWFAKFKDLCRARLVTLGVGNYHRFMRAPDPTLAEQMDMLVECLTPLAAGCRGLGLNLGIENHGDYWLSDLAALCEKVPHLGIFLDTGNTYLTGEAPLPAVKAGARYTVGTHFKDHHVAPHKSSPLSFSIRGSVLGEGDVYLRECYEIIKAESKYWDSIDLQIEFIPDREDDRSFIQQLKDSLAFLKTLD